MRGTGASRAAVRRLAAALRRFDAAPAGLLALAVAAATVACLAPAPARAQDARGSEPLLLDTSPAPVVVRLVPEPRASTAGQGEITVGDPFWVTVQTQGPAGYRLLPQSLIDAYAPRPELAILGSERRDGLWRLRIAFFRPGDVVPPSVQARVVTDRGDTIAVPVRSDTLRVASVLAPGDTVLADIKPLWRPGGVPWWVWALAAVALAVLLAWLVARRLRRRREEAPARAARDAYGVARARITDLGVEPADSERAVLATAGIGDALRDYLGDGWAIGARERTTLELLPALPPPIESERAPLGAILTTADLAKFARVAPARGEVPALATRALALLDILEEARRSAITADAGAEDRPPVVRRAGGTEAS